MGSGVIYAFLILIWAAYFVPRWLRRHDELSASRSVARFDRAMRILSRREPTPDRRYVVMPPRPAPIPTQRTRSSVRGRAVGRQVIRRRRILAGLMLLTLVVAVATPLSLLPWWAPVTALTIAVADLVHLRVQARRNRDLTRSRASLRTRTRSRRLRFDFIDRLISVRRELAEQRAAEDARWTASEEAERIEREAEERRAAEAAAGWAPVPVPLPTYVTKPMAPRPAPPIDLTRPGEWSAAQLPGARVAEQPMPAPAGAANMSALVEAADGADDELDAIIERRAVND